MPPSVHVHTAVKYVRGPQGTALLGSQLSTDTKDMSMLWSHRNIDTKDTDIDANDTDPNETSLPSCHFNTDIKYDNTDTKETPLL